MLLIEPQKLRKKCPVGQINSWWRPKLILQLKTTVWRRSHHFYIYWNLPVRSQKTDRRTTERVTWDTEIQKRSKKFKPPFFIYRNIWFKVGNDIGYASMDHHRQHVLFTIMRNCYTYCVSGTRLWIFYGALPFSMFSYIFAVGIWYPQNIFDRRLEVHHTQRTKMIKV